ncbi:hypothetical protein RHGRI_000273 [Rhododendron griersonianum]|uniref:C-terminal associated domain-containing protein n=1 Tax=Rhododendron griersonianum TaxID=479676 RepID=A0AAV6LIU2_9ERIC|nr:hypothetical protein RHGRI_000273 [Rhododendron griersonianum]
MGQVLVCSIVGLVLGHLVFISTTVTAVKGYAGAGINPAKCFSQVVVRGGHLWDGHWIFWVSDGVEEGVGISGVEPDRRQWSSAYEECGKEKINRFLLLRRGTEGPTLPIHHPQPSRLMPSICLISLAESPSIIISPGTPLAVHHHHFEGVKELMSSRLVSSIVSQTERENREYFNDLESHNKDIIWEDEQDGEAIELAFSKKKFEARKNWLRHFEV